MGKLICYFQLCDEIFSAAQFEKVGADESQDQMLALVLSLRDPVTIEQLFIDLNFMQQFIPGTIWNQSYVKCVTNMITSVDIIQQ